jgi:short-subunit dehydrogenase
MSDGSVTFRLLRTFSLLLTGHTGFNMSVSLYNACAVVGASTLSYVSFKALSALRFHLHSSKLQRYHHGDEPWALVTGASDGIGLAFVNQLAQHGFNVILHGRNETKLKKVLSEVQPKYKTSFKLLVLDATAPASPEFDETVLSAVRGLNLTVVIHNVAGNGEAQVEMPMFEDLSAKQCDGWINVNVRFTTHLTRLLLPLLLKSQPGLMVFVSSAVTEVSSPGVALYTGAKNYLEALAKCLQMEMKMQGHDIEMKSLTTGMVATASSGRYEKDISFVVPSTQTFARASLAKVGWGDTKVTPWIGHWLQFGLIKSLPTWLQEMMVIRMVRTVQDQMAKRN